MERRLVAAERLIAGLSSEKERWAADIQVLEAAKVQLVGDCLLCSSFLSYTGARSGCNKHVCVCCWHHDGPCATEMLLLLVSGGLRHLSPVLMTLL